jgi:hypothetical protein
VSVVSSIHIPRPFLLSITPTADGENGTDKAFGAKAFAVDRHKSINSDW